MNRKLNRVMYLLILSISLIFMRFSIAEVKLPDSYHVQNVNTGLWYATIQEAINANETLDGHVILLDLYVFSEHIIVNKSVALCGSMSLGLPPSFPDMTTIDGNGTGTIITVKADNVKIQSVKIVNGTNGVTVEAANSLLGYLNASNNADAGICFHNSINSTLEHSWIVDNYYGIWLNGSNSNSIYGSDITSNGDCGIYLENASCNIVSENQISGNYNGFILLSSSNNTISENQITNNHNGIYFSISHYNILSANKIADNNNVAIAFDHASNNTIARNNITSNICGINLNPYSKGNKFFHNNFTDNQDQVYIYEFTQSIANSWDDDYPSGGNYWSDYEQRYPNAGEIDESGIWDTPYVVDQYNIDRFPIIPELQLYMGVPLFMIATLIAVTVYRKKHSM